MGWKTAGRLIARPLFHVMLITALYGAFSFYFHRTFGLGFLGLDELNVFASFERATDAGLVVKEIFTPHNRHFTPVFKALLYLEYSAFGPSPVPYHAVSVALMAVSAILFYVFLKGETGSRTAALASTALFALNATYFSVAAWVFLQPLILTVILIELALLSVQRAAGDLRGSVLAGLYSMLASFCLSMGAAAWLFAAVYYMSRVIFAPPAERPSRRGLMLRLAPLLASAVATFVSYFLIRRYFPENTLTALVFDPARVASGVVVLMGSAAVKTLGFININRFVPMRATELSIVTGFIASIAAALLFFRRLGQRGRATAATGLFLSLFTSASVVSASLDYLKMKAFDMVNYDRFHYFPAFFMAVGVAPYLALAGRRARAGMLLVLPLWIAMHYFICSDLISLNMNRIDAIKNAIGFVRVSVKDNAPIVKHPDGSIELVPASMTRAVLLEDVAFFQEQRPSYKDLLLVYRDPDDMVVEYDEGFVFLRNAVPVPAEALKAVPEALAGAKGRGLSLSSSSRMVVYMGSDARKVAPFMHLSFRLRADRPSMAALRCVSLAGTFSDTGFEVEESLLHKLYVLPCPSMQEAALALAPGEYSLRDVKLHY